MDIVTATGAIAEAIRGLGEIPAGHLYARAMNRMTLAQFDSIINVLIGAGLVARDKSHLLTWVGPTLREE